MAFVAFSFSSCKNDVEKQKEAKMQQEGVVLDDEVQDVGAISRDIPVTVKVVITNNKPDSVQLMDPTTTCDCMKVNLQKRIMATKDTAIMTVTYNARIPGLFDKDVYVNYVGQDSILKFTIKGHVKQ